MGYLVISGILFLGFFAAIFLSSLFLSHNRSLFASSFF